MESVLTMTQLNDFLFCPRSLYYSGIYRNGSAPEFYHQTPQITGSLAHEAIDEGRYSDRRQVLCGIMVFCEKYGLTLKVTYKGTNDVEENIVLAQSPKAGEEVFENDVFTIVVSQRQSTTTTTTLTTTEDSGDALGE